MIRRMEKVGMIQRMKKDRIIQRVENEIKIIGINAFLVSAAFMIALIVFSAIAGELIDFYVVSFEVIFPFFATIFVGEWGKTRADSNFDIIAAQSKSLFRWVLLRYGIAFGISSAFAVLSMVGSFTFRDEILLWELLLIYLPPAFFLSSLCALLGIYCTREHSATLVCGVVWLMMLLVRSLLRVPGVEYIYLFIRYADSSNPVWLWNKGILAVAGFLLWGIIYLRCRNL